MYFGDPCHGDTNDGEVAYDDDANAPHESKHHEGCSAEDRTDTKRQVLYVRHVYTNGYGMLHHVSRHGWLWGLRDTLFDHGIVLARLLTQTNRANTHAEYTNPGAYDWIKREDDRPKHNDNERAAQRQHFDSVV